MAKANERKQQQKREKHKRKREQAKLRARAQAQADALPTSERGLVKLASAGDFGPAWIGEDWDTPAEAHRAVPLVITRRLRGRLYLGQLVFVDRSCLGAQHPLLLRPADEHELRTMVAELRDEGAPMVPCDVLVAQSILFHGLDFAASLGFEPHRDFHRSMFEPRPSELIETAGARPARPSYFPDPDEDDVGEILSVLEHLDEVVGPGNYDFMGRPRETPDLASVFREPPDLSMHPADTGGDPERIDWRKACVGVPWAEPLLVSDDYTPDWEIIDIAEILTVELESGYAARWEAVLRHEQSLPLSPAQREIVDALGVGGERIETIGGDARPCEPWYLAFDRLLDHLIVDRLSTTKPIDPDRLNCGPRLLDAVEAHATPLSLPPGAGRLADLLTDERVSKIRIQALFDTLSGLGQVVGKKRISLADPEQRPRIKRFLLGFVSTLEHFVRLEWSIEDWLRQIEMPEDERCRLLDAIGSDYPELLRRPSRPSSG